MIGERSKGKARPRLTRSSDLRPAETDAIPTEQRAAHGHFSVGNRSAVAARFKATMKKALGAAGEGDAGIVARDARRVLSHVLASLPSSAAPVRVLVSIHARHVALHAFYTTKAEEAGLETPKGLELLAVADRQSQRAERVLVSAMDAARVCAAQEGSTRGNALEAMRARLGDGGRT
jgi:hypothetical protein